LTWGASGGYRRSSPGGNSALRIDQQIDRIDQQIDQL
jgi:hypothetical protein